MSKIFSKAFSHVIAIARLTSRGSYSFDELSTGEGCANASRRVKRTPVSKHILGVLDVGTIFVGFPRFSHDISYCPYWYRCYSAVIVKCLSTVDYSISSNKSECGMVIGLVKEHRLPKPTVSLQAFVVRLKANRFIVGGSTGAAKVVLTANRCLMQH